MTERVVDYAERVTERIVDYVKWVLGVWLKVALVVVVGGGGIAVLATVIPDAEENTTSRGICEDLWAENESTADYLAGTDLDRDRYVSNCMQTNDDLGDW